MTYKKYILPSLGTLFLVLTLAVMTSNVSDPLKQQLVDSLAGRYNNFSQGGIWNTNEGCRGSGCVDGPEVAQGGYAITETSTAPTKAQIDQAYRDAHPDEYPNNPVVNGHVLSNEQTIALFTQFASTANPSQQLISQVQQACGSSCDQTALRNFAVNGLDYFYSDNDEIDAVNQAYQQSTSQQQGQSGAQSTTALQEQKDICLMDGGFWTNNSCSYPDVGQLIQDVTTLDLYRTFASGQNDAARNQIVDLCKSSGGANCDSDPRSFALNELQGSGITTTYIEQQYQKTQTGINPANITSSAGTSAPANQLQTSINEELLEKSQATAQLLTPTLTNLTQYSDLSKKSDGSKCSFASECGSGYCQYGGRGAGGGVCTNTGQAQSPVTSENVVRNFADCNRPGMTSTQTKSCNESLSKAYNLPIIGDYLQAYAPQNVDIVWQSAGYESLQACQSDLGSKYGQRGAQSCNTYQVTKEQATSSIKLGTAITAATFGAGALPGIAATGATAGGGAALAQGFLVLGGVTTLNQTANAVTAHIQDPGSEEAWKQTGYAALSWANLTTADMLIKGLGGAKLLNTLVSGANIYVDFPAAIDECAKEDKSFYSCGGAIAAVVADVGFGALDYKQGQLGFDNPFKNVNNSLFIPGGVTDDAIKLAAKSVPDTIPGSAIPDAPAISPVFAPPAPVTLMDTSATINPQDFFTPNRDLFEAVDIDGSRIATDQELNLLLGNANSPEIPRTTTVLNDAEQIAAEMDIITPEQANANTIFAEDNAIREAEINAVNDRLAAFGGGTAADAQPVRIADEPKPPSPTQPVGFAGWWDENIVNPLNKLIPGAPVKPKSLDEMLANGAKDLPDLNWKEPSGITTIKTSQISSINSQLATETGGMGSSVEDVRKLIQEGSFDWNISNNDPITAFEMPDGTYHIQTGRHRAEALVLENVSDVQVKLWSLADQAASRDAAPVATVWDRAKQIINQIPETGGGLNMVKLVARADSVSKSAGNLITPTSSTTSEILGPSTLPARTGINTSNQLAIDQKALLRDTGLPNPRDIEANPQKYLQELNIVAEKNGLAPITLGDNPSPSEIRLAAAEVEYGLIQKYEANTPDDVIAYKIGLAITSPDKLTLGDLPTSPLLPIKDPVPLELSNANTAELKKTLSDEAASLQGELIKAKHTDEKTGLVSEFGANEGLRVMMESDIDNVSVIMVDLAGLKKVNDRFGHDAGDRFIQIAGDIFESVSRKVGVIDGVKINAEDILVSHPHGDEYMIIIPGADSDRAQKIISLFREELTLRQKNAGRGDLVKYLGFDAGVAQWNGTETPGSLIKKADALMYVNKNARKLAEAKRNVFQKFISGDLFKSPDARSGIDVIDERSIAVVDSIGPIKVPDIKNDHAALAAQIHADQRQLILSTGLPDPRRMNMDPVAYKDQLIRVAEANGLTSPVFTDSPTLVDLKRGAAQLELEMILKYESYTPREVADYKIALATEDVSSLPPGTIPNIDPAFKDITSNIGKFETDEAEVLALAQQIGDLKQAITKVRNIDIKTGLLNQKGGNEAIEALVRSGKIPVSVIGIDISGLKNVNDTFGHAAGDRLIQIAADIFSSASRKVDIVVHPHGDEYWVVLPGAKLEEAQELITRFNAELAARKASSGLDPDTKIIEQLGFDAGAVEWDGVEDAASVLKRADDLMYTNKQARKAAENTIAPPKTIGNGLDEFVKKYIRDDQGFLPWLRSEPPKTSFEANSEYIQKYSDGILPVAGITDGQYEILKNSIKEDLNMAQARTLERYAKEVNKLIENTNGPAIELGGPTLDGFRQIDTSSLNKQLIVSNTTNGLPVYDLTTGKHIGNIGKVDKIIDATNLGMNENSVGAFVAQSLPHDVAQKLLDEAYLVLEPGGILVLDQTFSDILPRATNLGYKVVKQNKYGSGLHLVLQKPFVNPKLIPITDRNLGNLFGKVVNTNQIPGGIRITAGGAVVIGTLVIDRVMEALGVDLIDTSYLNEFVRTFFQSQFLGASVSDRGIQKLEDINSSAGLPAEPTFDSPEISPPVEENSMSKGVVTNDNAVKSEELFSGSAQYTQYSSTLLGGVNYHVVRIDLDNVEFFVTPPQNATTTSDFLETYGVDIAINGDGWSYVTDEFGNTFRKMGGLAASDGVQYGGPIGGEQTLYLGKDGSVSLEKPVEIWNAISFPNLLIQDGQIIPHPDKTDTNPRTALGVTNDGVLIIVAVDGKEYSSGVTVAQLTQIMAEQGAVLAVNFDGGTSSTLAIQGDDGNPVTLNNPDSPNPSGENQVANHLGIKISP